MVTLICFFIPADKFSSYFSRRSVFLHLLFCFGVSANPINDSVKPHNLIVWFHVKTNFLYNLFCTHSYVCNRLIAKHIALLLLGFRYFFARVTFRGDDFYWSYSPAFWNPTFATNRSRKSQTDFDPGYFSNAVTSFARLLFGFGCLLRPKPLLGYFFALATFRFRSASGKAFQLSPVFTMQNTSQ